MLLGTVTDSTEPDVFLKAPLTVNGRKGGNGPRRRLACAINVGVNKRGVAMTEQV